MRRSLAILLTGGLLVLGSLALASGTSAATIAASTTCSNGVDNTGGLGLICQVTVVNTITASGGSARVTVRECHGAAGDPQAACSTKVANLTKPVTAVTQCNSSINGGGGTLRCSVQVTNNFMGLSSGSTAATVNQCVGSGGGITTGCDPYPATTSGAAITQCNGSANGGTLVGLTCTATGTKSAAQRVTINQCNGSANGGGALVICSASIANHSLVTPTPTPTTPTPTPTTPTPTPTATPTPTPTTSSRPTGGVQGATATPGTTLPSTSTIGSVDRPADRGFPISLAALIGLGLSVLLFLTPRRRVSHAGRRRR
jgi:cell division septation protein DedD